MKWAMEKSSLESARLEAEKKVKELDEQASHNSNMIEQGGC